MTNVARAIELPIPTDYGAVEVKEWIKKHTLRAFLITCILLLLFFLIYFIAGSAGKADAAPKLAPIVKLTLEDIADDAAEESAPPPPTEMIINTGPASRAGTPVPVPETEITEDLKEFASMDELSRASSEGGEGLDLGGFAKNIDWDKKVNVDVREEEPEPDEFIPVEKEPGLDYKRLQELVKYPDIARKAGIEGKVIVRVLVEKNGKVKRTLVEYTDSEMLNESAVKAIKDYGTFTPAIQNGQPVTCWVSIPITFRLR